MYRLSCLTGALWLLGACGGSITDNPEPPSAPPTVTLSITPDHLSAVGGITIAAVATGSTVRQVDFYQRHVGVDALVLVASDSVLPYEFRRDIASMHENGTWEFMAKAQDANGNVATSNTVTAVVNIVDDRPLETGWDVIWPVDGVLADERPVMLAIDAMSNIYLAASTPGSSQDRNFVLTKFDASGNQQWTRTFGGPNSDVATALGVDPSGRVYVAVATPYPPPEVGGDCALFIFDPAPQLLRTRLVGGSHFDRGGGCVATSDALGNFYLAGAAHDSTGGEKFVIKYDRDGQSLWTRKFTPVAPTSPKDWEVISAMVADPSDGGAYVAGFTSTFDALPDQVNASLFVVKFDRDGNRQWTGSYRVPMELPSVRSIALDPEGGVYAVGVISSIFGTGSVYDALIVHFGSDGRVLWTRQLDSGGEDTGEGVAADRSSVYVVGSIHGDAFHDFDEPPQGPRDGFLAKLSPDGALLSTRLLGSAKGAAATSVVIAPDGAVLVSAFSAWSMLRDYHPGVDPTSPLEIARHREARP